jgi:hypothetical protein
VASSVLFGYAATSHAAGPVTLTVPAAKGANGKVVNVRIELAAAPEAPGVGALQFAVLYDPQILEPQDAVAGSAAARAAVQSSTSAPGRLGLSLVTTDNITNAGEVVVVHFKVLGKKGQTSTLELDGAKAWQGDVNLFDIRVASQPGVFTVASPSAFPWWIIVAVGVGLLIVIVAIVRRRNRHTAAPVPPVAGADGDYVYVQMPTPVVARDGQQIGNLEPGRWYRANRQDGQWLEVTDEAGLTGWVDANHASRQT